MFKYFTVAINSSRGFKLLKFHTHLEKGTKAFNDEIIEKVQAFYFDSVSDIQILTVEEDRFIGRM